MRKPSFDVGTLVLSYGWIGIITESTVTHGAVYYKINWFDRPKEVGSLKTREWIEQSLTRVYVNNFKAEIT